MNRIPSKSARVKKHAVPANEGYESTAYGELDCHAMKGREK